MIVNEIKFAALIGCSPKTVSNLIDGGMPAEGGGKRGVHLRIDPAAALQWYIEHETNRRAIDQNAPVEDIDAARLQKLVEEHRKLKIDNDAEELRLLDADQVRQVFSAALVEFGALLDGAAVRMARGNDALEQNLSDEHARVIDTFALRLSVFGALP